MIEGECEGSGKGRWTTDDRPFGTGTRDERVILDFGLCANCLIQNRNQIRIVFLRYSDDSDDLSDADMISSEYFSSL